MLGTSEIRQTLRRRGGGWHGEATAEHAAASEHDTTGAKPQDAVLAIGHFTKEGELQLELPSSLTLEQVVFLAELRSLAKRAEKNRVPVRQEVLRLLENACECRGSTRRLEKSRGAPHARCRSA